MEGLDSKIIDVLVYVKVQTFMAKNLLNQLMTYIGGQVKIQCSHHKLPLIISNKEKVYCYHHKSGTGVKCSKKVKYQCPQLICQCGICHYCYQEAVENDKAFVDPPSVVVNTDHYEHQADVSSHDDSLNGDSDSEENHRSVSFDMDDLIGPEDEDNINDFVVVGGGDDVPSDNIVSEYFPTTLAGDEPFTVYEDGPTPDRINAHVILNQWGSLLNRHERDIIGFRSHKCSLQRMASTHHGNSIPLLYPEVMLFPSTFWSQVPSSGAILGAIPSGLLVQSNLHGIADIKSHTRCRLCLPFSTTSTDPTYISFQYDILANLTMTHGDSRIILNRGLVESSDKTGLQVRSRGENLLTDSVDSKQTVRNLCSSQKYHKMDFFSYIYLQPK